MDYLYTIINAIWDILLEMSPFLLLGFTIAGVLHVFIPPKTITKHIGKKNAWSVIKATLLGVPLPLCSCGVIPTGVSFHKNGATKGATNAFLISTPQTGVDSILITSSLMGWPWAIARPLIALITGVFGGLLTDKIDKDGEIEAVESCSDCSIKEKKHWLWAIISYAFLEFLPDISRQLVVGILLAVAITLVIPPSLFTDHLTNPFVNMILILIASIPLYICATGSVPMASALLLQGVSPGAVLVFLMAGPATNAATLSVLWKSLGKKSTIAYLISIIGGALFFGFLIDYVLPSNWFIISNAHSTHIHGDHTSWVSVISAILLVSLIVYVELKKVIKIKNKKMNNNIYQVTGMMCNHCKNSVETNLAKMDKVESVQVDLEKKSVSVVGSISLEEVKNKINDLGYEFIKKI